MNIPRVVIPDNAVGIDKAVGVIQTDLAAKFDWLDHLFGASQLMKKKGKNRADYTYPAIHYKNDRYLNMFPNEKKYGNTCFFIIGDPQDIEDYIPNKQTRSAFDCSIVFWFNLNDIYPGAETRNKEAVKAELLNFINTQIKYNGVRFKVTNIAEQFDNIYAEYSEDEINQQLLMQPYCALRFDGYMTIDETCIINLPLTYDITLTADVGGSVEPFEGTETRNRNEVFAVNAVPDAGYSFLEWSGNVANKFDALTTVLADKTKEAIAYFESLFVIIQDVFGTSTIDQKFIDQVGNNDVTYKNVQVGTFDGVSSHVDVGSISLGTSYMFEIDCVFNILTPQRLIDNSGNTNSLLLVNSTTIRYVGNDIILYNFTINELSIGTRYNIQFKKDDEELTLSINGADYNLTTAVNSNDTIDNIGFRESNNSQYLNAQVSKCFIEDKFTYYFQDGDDTLCVDTSGNGNDGTYNGSDLESFRGTRIDNIDSVLILNGYSSFQQIADPTKFIYAPYTDAGVPTHTSIAGYEEPIEIPKNVVSDNRILYDGLLGSVGGLNNTYNEINALTAPEYEVTKTADYISNVKVKQ